MRASTLLLAGLVAGAGLFTYQVKHRVSVLDRELAQSGRAVLEEQDRMHVLDAEWSLLNEPDRLRRLAGQYLQLQPMQPRQFAELSDAVRRLPPAPAPQPMPAAPTAEPATVAAPPPAQPAAPPAAAAAATPAVPAAPRVPAPAAPSTPLRTAAAGIQQESLPPPPGHRASTAPRSATPLPTATPSPPPSAAPAAAPAAVPRAVPARAIAPAPSVSPPQAGSALGGSAPSLAPPTPWRAPGQ
jgi:hypothetical protein